jgi:maltose O-acetyltransferase
MIGSNLSTTEIVAASLLGSLLGLSFYKWYFHNTVSWKSISTALKKLMEDLEDSIELKKMVSGKRYVVDEGLLNLLTHAHRLCDQYNLPEVSVKDRSLIVSELFCSVGKGTYIEAPFHCDYGFNITVGENFYCNFNVILLDCNKINIGNNVFLAPGVQILTASHPIDAVERRSVEFALPVTIGNDVWIGANALILPGVTVGSRVVIAAGAVVNKDVEDDVVVAGVPARVVKRITK